MPERDEILFPYMVWAHTEAFRSPYCLSQSGMPLPDAELLPDIPAARVLCHPAAEALPRLEARLAALFAVAPERVIATVGASGAMHLCALRWFGHGARVVVDTPSYEPFRALPRLLGAELCPLERELADGWRLAPERVAAALAGAHPGHVFVANPNNPTGAVAPGEEIAALARAAETRGGVLVACEVYMEYARPDERVHAARIAPNGVSIGSLTKAYGLGPLRIGWIVLGEGLLAERERLRDMAYLAWVDPPSASLWAGISALERLEDFLRPLRRVEAESRRHLVRWLEETQGVRAHVPPFGIISFPRIEGIDDTRALAAFLAREFGVDVVPGEFFGRPGHLRVGCGVPEATLVEGLVRLGDGLRAFRERAR